MASRYRDRVDAGKRLAEELTEHRLVDPLVLALPRGGVPVAFEVAEALEAPLDVFVARKLGAPGHPELGIGAIAEGDGTVVDAQAMRALSLQPSDIDVLERRERQELDRRVARYRQGRPLPDLAGRDVILVDDGLATGVTAEAALRTLRERQPRTIVLAVPVCAAATVERLRAFADEVVCPMCPPHFRAVGAWYENFDQTSDDEVLELLEWAA